MTVNIKNDKGNTRRRNGDISTLVYGKVPPQAGDFENAVLGAMLLERDCIDRVMEIIPSSDCFYFDANQKIYEAIKSVIDKGLHVDTLTVSDELRITDNLEVIGGIVHLAQLTNDVVSSAHVESHARIIMEKYWHRELIRVGGTLVTLGYDEQSDIFESLGKAEAELDEACTVKAAYKKPGQLMMQALKRIEESGKSKHRFTGVPTGYDSLDRVTYGWQKEDLIIIGARPSVGKTALALNLGLNAALHKIKPTPVAFFSLEMSELKIADRALAMMSDVPLDAIKTGKLSPSQRDRLYRASERYATAPIYIEDTGGLTITEFKIKARRLVKTEKVGLIIIDYLQLMKGLGDNRNTNRENEISTISRELKALAKELHVPIIALSQLNREVEKRKTKEPELADIRESGSIEQDADMVLFVWRDSYQKTDIEKKSLEPDDTYIKIGKARDGKIMKLLFKALLTIQRFFEPHEFDLFIRNIKDDKDFGIDDDLPF